jgi:hypothetical protein
MAKDLDACGTLLGSSGHREQVITEELPVASSWGGVFTGMSIEQLIHGQH